MPILYESLHSLLGGEKITGAEGMDYGSWTPNGVRSVCIFADLLLVEYHPPYNKGKVVIRSAPESRVLQEISSTGGKVKNPLNVLTDFKKFMTLEEVLIDAALELDTDRFLSKVDPKSRLRKISTLRWNVNMSRALANRLADGRKASPESLIVDMFGMSPISAVEGPGAEDWFGRFALNPRDYRSDLTGGPLESYFAGIARAHGLNVGGAADGEDSIRDPRVIKNLEIHKVNAPLDQASIEAYRTVVEEAARLRKFGGGAKADQNSAKKLYKGLMEIVNPPSGEEVAGLGYYCNEFDVSDELLTIYKDRGYIKSEEPSKSSSLPEGTGYFNVEKGLVKAMSASYRERVDNKLYVPDVDLFKPIVDNLHDFVSMVIGEGFDVTKTSKELQLLQATGELETQEALNKFLAESKDKYKSKEAQDMLDEIEKSLREENAKGNVSFFQKAVDGTVQLSRDTYVNSIAKSGTKLAEGSVKYGHIGVQLAIDALCKGRPWGWVLGPFVDPLLNLTDKAMLPVLYDALDAVDKAAEGERQADSELTPEREAMLKEIFARNYFGQWGFELLFKLVEDIEVFSKLKYRQVARIAHSASGIAGLSAFLKKHPEIGGTFATPLFKRFHYLDVTQGLDSSDKGGYDINFEHAKLLKPELFYREVMTGVLSMKNQPGDHHMQWIESAQGPQKLAVYDYVIRRGFGLPSRSYGNVQIPPEPGEVGAGVAVTGEVLPSKGDKKSLGDKFTDKLSDTAVDAIAKGGEHVVKAVVRKKFG